jgi:hypothetical protein
MVRERNTKQPFGQRPAPEDPLPPRCLSTYDAGSRFFVGLGRRQFALPPHHATRRHSIV